MATISAAGKRPATFTVAETSRVAGGYVMRNIPTGSWKFMGTTGSRSAPFGAVVGYKCFWG